MIEIIFLLIFIILGALVAVGEKSLFSSEVALGVVGTALCVIFFVLRAPEVAIAQLIAELLLLVIMIRAGGVRRDMTEYKSARERFALFAVFVFFSIFALFSLWALYSMPKFGNPLMTVSHWYIQHGLNDRAEPNVVSSVLLRFRHWDVVGQLSAIVAATVGVMAVLRKKGRKQIDDRND